MVLFVDRKSWGSANLFLASRFHDHKKVEKHCFQVFLFHLSMQRFTELKLLETSQFKPDGLGSCPTRPRNSSSSLMPEDLGLIETYSSDSRRCKSVPKEFKLF
jgi:hypothetical protein